MPPKTASTPEPYTIPFAPATWPTPSDENGIRTVSDAYLADAITALISRKRRCVSHTSRNITSTWLQALYTESARRRALDI